MGWVTAEEGTAWQPWLDELAAARRVVLEENRWFAVEASRDPRTGLRGRMEALGPVFAGAEANEQLLRELETEGVVLRTRISGREAWCDRRLLARIHRYTLDRLRREIEPVSAAQFLRFLGCWQHADPEHRLEGPKGVAHAISQLAGFDVPAAAWEGSVLPARVRGYKREWLDQLTFSGEVAWARLWISDSAAGPTRRTPVCLVPREDLDTWASLAPSALTGDLSANAAAVRDVLSSRGAMFFPELARSRGLTNQDLEEALSELIGLGLVTCDSYSGLRWLIVPAWRRKAIGLSAGRWSLLPRGDALSPDAAAEFVARRLLRRTGVVFRKTLAREKQPVFWREIARALRRLEARGEIRGGRFVSGFDGEQYALPEAIPLLRAVRRRSASAEDPEPLMVSAADPLNYRGILTPDERVSPGTRRQVAVA
jgi:ATP-dependent Lhr-like helicase